jgi:hypothetical protein
LKCAVSKPKKSKEQTVPIQPKPARAASLTETKLFNASDLSALNHEFTSNGIGNLTWLDEQGANTPSVQDSWLTIQNTKRTPVWYSDSSGTMLYAYVSGDFMVETKVTANLRKDTTKRSDSRYTSAGLVVRDPTSTPDKMRWMVFNIGSQDGFFGTEVKTTRDGKSGFLLNAITGNTSLSTWFTNKLEGSSNEAQLRICRIGSELRFLIKPTEDSVWQEIELTDSTVRAGSKAPVSGVNNNGPMRFQRPDLPAILQVGLMTNDIGNAGTGEGRFDYLRFQRIHNFEDCSK